MNEYLDKNKHINEKGHIQNSLYTFKSTKSNLWYIVLVEQYEHDVFAVKFYEELDKGNIDITIPKDSAKVYHMKFKDSTGGYAQNTERTFCKLGVKFIEPNPTNRT